jgi:hypothetical protein
VRRPTLYARASSRCSAFSLLCTDGPWWICCWVCEKGEGVVSERGALREGGAIACKVASGA